MKIAIASIGDPKSVATWSGIPAHISLALEARGHQVLPISLQLGKEQWYYNWLRRFYLRIERKWLLTSVEETWLRPISMQLDVEVDRLQPDVVLVIHGDWLAYSTFQQPACIIHDTTFASILNYYPSFSNLTSRSVRLGNKMYRKALERADAAVFSADWASRSAIIDYGVPTAKINTIPFGANIYSEPNHETVQSWINKRISSRSCNLLFIGTDWKRKGGEDALRFVDRLNRLGIKSFLTIVGCDPVIPAEFRYFVHNVGYLKKNVKQDAEKLNQILKSSHALLLPTLAECFGCVYCEANAYGLPALGRNTGGVSEIIHEGVNGFLLQPGELPEVFADRWAMIWQDRTAYKQISLNAYTEYKKRLNYAAFANKLESILFQLVYNQN